MTRLTLAPPTANVGPAAPVAVGLSSAEAQRRLTEFGPNEIRREQTTKALTLRLPVDQAEALEAIAGVDEVSINEEIRRAIAAHIEARRQDKEFRERLRASMDRNREILERLAR